MKKLDYGDVHVGRNIFNSALPLMIAQFLMLLYNIVDRFYIGRIEGIGTVALGAVGFCFPVIQLITGVTNLFGLGGSPLFGMALGEKRPEKAGQIVNTAYRCLCLSAAAILVFGELLAPEILTLFGAEGEALRYGLPYLRIYLLGTLFVMVAGGLNPYITAQGFPRAGMVSVVIGGAANLILDPLFIFGLGLGVGGAAWATVLSRLLSVLYCLRFFAAPEGLYKLRLIPRKGEAALRYAGDIAALGVVPFIMQATNSLVSIAANHELMIWGGPLYVSAMTIVMAVRSMMEVAANSIAQGAAPLISYNYGARDAGKIRSGIRIMTLANVGYTLIVWIMLALFPAFFSGIFTSDETLNAITIPALHIYFFAFVFQALQFSGQNVFRAMNKRRQALFFSIFRKVILVVPLTLLLPHLWGLGSDGVFLAEPVSNFLGGTLCYVTMWRTISRELADWPEPQQA